METSPDPSSLEIFGVHSPDPQTGMQTTGHIPACGSAPVFEEPSDYKVSYIQALENKRQDFRPIQSTLCTT